MLGRTCCPGQHGPCYRGHGVSCEKESLSTKLTRVFVTREFTEFFNNTVASLRIQLQEAVNGANSALDSAVEVVNRVPGVDIEAPDLNPDIDFLDNVGIPDGFLQALVSFNESLPTLEELKDRMNGVIAIPFEALRSEIATNLGNVTVDRDAFPIPEKESLAFCQVCQNSRIMMVPTLT